MRTLLGVFVRALRTAYRREARRQGLAGGETGTVTSVQPTNFIVDREGIIRWIYRPDTYRLRISIDELLAALDELRLAA